MIAADSPGSDHRPLYKGGNACQHIIVPKAVFQCDQFRFIGHIPVNMPDNNLIFIKCISQNLSAFEHKKEQE